MTDLTDNNMFKSQKSLYITGILIYILYICAFKYLFAPLHYGVAFYLAAFCYVVWFVAFSCDFYPECQAEKDSSKETDGRKYRTNSYYAVASLIAILLLLLSVTALLVTMVLNQHELYVIPWYYQVLVFIVTVPVMWAVQAIFDAGRSVGPISFVLSYGSGASGICSNSQTLAKEIVDEALCTFVNRGDIADGADMFADLGLDEFDLSDLGMLISESFQKKYGMIPELALSHSGTSPFMNEFLKISSDYHEKKISLQQWSDKIYRLMPTVQDYYILYAEMIRNRPR